MKAFLKKFFKKLWQIIVRIFSFAPYVYSLEQVYEHEKEKVHELENELEKRDSETIPSAELDEQSKNTAAETVMEQTSAGKDELNAGE